MKDNYCIIMAGGVGSRFWPISRTEHPKQFIDILGTGSTLIQQTFERIKKLCPKENIYIVTHTMYKELVMQQLPGISENQVICEPARRNTAPCIAYASYKVLQKNPDALFVVAPSDHIILQEDVFVEKMKQALEAARTNNWLVTLGIQPTRPDTGYGYIQYTKDSVANGALNGIRKVKTFTEKPNLEMAKKFLESGDFLWNSGMFVWSLKSIIAAFDQHLPEVSSVFREGTGKYGTPVEEEFIKGAYTMCRSISIDYGIMEKADNVYVLPSSFGWSDLGTWGSLHDNKKKDQQNNAVTGKEVMLYGSKNCVIHIPEGKLAVIQGLDGYIVVQDENTLLVCRLEDEQQIRQIVNDVKMEKGEGFV